MNAGANDFAAGHRRWPLLVSMARTRLELAGLELEAHVVRSIGALALAAVAVVLLLIALAFVGMVVVALWWDTHRVVATVGVTLAYLLLALGVAARARARWRARPAPFAATLHELERDRDAMRAIGRGLP